MDAVMQFFTQVFLIAALVGFLALMAAAAGAIIWAGYHVLHDHWTLARTWQEAQSRMYGRR